MWKDRLSFSDLKGEASAGLTRRIEGLKAMGCGLLRFAVPDLESAEILGNLAPMVSMPLVADIHFDHKIALRCLDFPIAKLRINPGNIGSRDRVEAVLSKAASARIPIRIGVNAGSLPADLRAEVDAGRLDTAEALVRAAQRELAVFEEFGFQDVIVSMKASGIADTISANRIFAARSDVPLHIGVTEAGPLAAGVARNSAALITLLSEGIGDTIRVSLSDSVENELIAGREILAAVAELAGEKPRGVRIVSCPLCGRSSFDTHAFTARWLGRLYAMDCAAEKDITVAIMGCAVNGPGEARHADLGISGAGDKVLIFRRGKVVRTISEAEADAAFEEELERL
ncbi:MAG: (E)-4-hydroxy-3-methylbut-2-enyl-diphosphate synthase [Treponema sp.]|nr:(E)-4-hydroxy-3-methylbut-2-enyl-diphosphate synthase [Treponema sp.]